MTAGRSHFPTTLRFGFRRAVSATKSNPANPNIPVGLLRRLISAAERGMETDAEIRAVEGAKMYIEIHDSFSSKK